MIRARPYALELEIGRLDLLYRQNLTAPLTLAIFTFIFVITAGPYVPAWILAVWALIINGNGLIRGLAVARWRKARKEISVLEDLKPWFRIVQVGCLVSGLGLGVVAWISTFWLGGREQVILGVLIAGTISSTVTIYSGSCFVCALLAVIPSMSLWALAVLLSGMEGRLVWLIGILTYIAIHIRVAKMWNRESKDRMKMNLEVQEHKDKLWMALEFSGAVSWRLNPADGEFAPDSSIGNLLDRPAHSIRTVKDYLDGVAEADRAEVERAFREAGATGAIDVEHRIVAGAGVGKGFRHLALRGKAHRDQNGDFGFLTGILWDITDQKQAEILRFERDLAESAGRAKLVFLANVSHEIRTPLTAINGFAESLLDTAGLSPRGRELTEVILRNGRYLTSIVHDLLDLSKAETDHIYIQKTHFSLLEEINDSLLVVKSAVERKGLKLVTICESPVPRQIHSDSTRIRQILINLISNAVKYTSQGSITVRVRFEELPGEIGRAHIQVSDTGIGIADDVRERLFQPFSRGAAAELRRVPGSGLGLALSRSLALRLGGDLKLVDSRLETTGGDGGTTFELTLDTGSTHGQELVAGDSLRPGEGVSAAGRARHAGFSGKHILIVEDDEDIRWLLNDYLVRNGAGVESCVNGLEAVNRATRVHFDAILMDIKMPVMDGHQATSALRKSGVREPIIALTAHASAADQLLCYRSGFDSYLSKPIDFGHLYETLRVHLGIDPVPPFMRMITR